MADNVMKTSEDSEMTECNGEKVVTMMDVLQEQQDFEDDANAVLGASDDKNCTYSKGYVKRQAVYACLTCCPDAPNDPTKRAGICLACSLACHENHELVELYTKRNFRCDCGNPKFTQPCQFTPNKSELNYENKYNQNFSGVYCICKRPYPDPEATEEEEMIQCIICEDWLHTNHLEATVPSNDQYAEMICKECMDDYGFLHDYSDLVVNTADKEIIVMDPDLDFDIKEPIKPVVKESLTNGTNETKSSKDDEAESVLNSIDSIVGENKINTDVIMSEAIPKENDNKISDEAKVEGKSDENKVEGKSDKSKLEGKSDEAKIEGKSDEAKEEGKSDEAKEEGKSDEANKEGNIDEAKEEGKSEGDIENNEGDLAKNQEPKENNNTERQVEDTTESLIVPPETTNDEKSQEIKSSEEANIENTTDEPSKDSEETSDKQSIDTQKIDTQTEEKQDQNLASETNEPDNVEKAKEIIETSYETTNKNETTPNLQDRENKEKEGNEKNEITTEQEDEELVPEKVEHKRKLSTEDRKESSPKKAKIEEPCLRPKGVKRVYKGATFWPTIFRQKLCTCGECIAMYKDLAVMYLTDLEDTVTAYEALGKENSDGTPSSQYEKGLQALSSLDRVQQINALTEYNKMRDKLLDFLKSFKDRKEIVKEEDIKAFFAGMKPKREPDGVYFCR